MSASPDRPGRRSPVAGHASPDRRRFVMTPSKLIASPMKKMKVDDDSSQEVERTDQELSKDAAADQADIEGAASNSPPWECNEEEERVARETEGTNGSFGLGNSQMQADIEGAASDSPPWENNEEEEERVARETEETYGLLGLGDPQLLLEQITEFSHLPPFSDILENIFCYLPVTEYSSLMLVCKAWHSILSKFMPWKMKYQKVKYKDALATDMIIDLMKEESTLVSNQTDLFGIIRYLGKEFSKKKRSWEAINDCLRHHTRYDLCRKLLLERLPDSFNEKEIANPWCIVGGLVVLSHSVQEVMSVISLYNRHPTSRALDILEAFYCMATFLCPSLPCRTNPGIHYRVYYSLSLFETLGQSDSSAIRFTSEQLKIINAKFDHSNNIIKINALAGTGKTSTLRGHAAANPQKRFLYVAFNRSVKLEAKRTFTRNVECRTCHSLAYGNVGKGYANAKKLLNGNMSPYWYSKALPLLGNDHQRRGETNIFSRASLVCNTIKNYMASADNDLTSRHVPTYKRDRSGEVHFISDNEKQEYVGDAIIVWKQMKDLQNKTVRLPHDGYLKLYQLRKPTLYGYDCLLIDEAQDLTPAIQDIFMRQSCVKILVGDPYQQIYSFRGAVNTMRLVQATQNFSLTQSFRFGPEIAYLASCLLLALKKFKQKNLIGNKTPCSIYGEEVEGQLAIIARTNACLFNEAVEYCVANPRAKISFAGGLESFGMNLIKDIWLLQMPASERLGRAIKNPMIAKFVSMFALEEYATITNDKELLGKIKIVKTHHINIDRYVDMLLAQNIKDMSRADVVFSTIHKAKGLEFDTVKLTDDYLGGQASNVIYDKLEEDEKNMIYVAVTRAKKRLLVTKTLLNVLRQIGEHYDFPEESMKLLENNPTLRCSRSNCHQTPLNNCQPLLTMRMPRIKLGSGDIMEEKAKCAECAESQCIGWGQLVEPLEPVVPVHVEPGEPF